MSDNQGGMTAEQGAILRSDVLAGYTLVRTEPAPDVVTVSGAEPGGGGVRGTGGNQFVPGDATPAQVMSQAWRQVEHLEEYAREVGRTFDVGALTIETKRIPSGAISVTVSADLGPTTTTQEDR